MKPLSHEELNVSGIAIQKAAEFIHQHTGEAIRLIEELPSKNMFASSEDAYIDVKFATADELQCVLMQVFKGRLVVHTEAVSIDDRPQVEATAMLMTEEGMIPMARSMAGVEASHEFIMGQKAFLSAETRAIRKVLNHLGLLPEDESDDPVVAKMKSTQVEHAEPEYLEPHKDSAEHDMVDQEQKSLLEPAVPSSDKSQGKATSNVAGTNRKTAKKPAKKPAAKAVSGKKTAAAKSTKANASGSASGVPTEIPEAPLKITLPVDDDAWPDVTAVTYVDSLSKGVEAKFKSLRAANSDFTLERFIRGVLGKDAQSGYTRLSLKRLRIVELESLYAYYVHEVRPEQE